MTRLLVVNPNTSLQMTQTIRVAADAAARSIDVDVDVICPTVGPESIEGKFDEVVSAYWTLDCVMQVADRYDGIVVACFSPHPAIDAIREATDVPTMGIMEAAILYALPLGASFSIVTTSPRWEPLLKEGLKSLGIEGRCASVRSSGLAVLDLEHLPTDQVCARLAAEAQAAVALDGAEVIVLGCAGMAGLQHAVAAAATVPVVDAVYAGVVLVGALARSGAHTSKHRSYHAVDPRPTVRVPPGLARVYQAGVCE